MKPGTTSLQQKEQLKQGRGTLQTQINNVSQTTSLIFLHTDSLLILIHLILLEIVQKDSYQLWHWPLEP
jgi:hypothetical protein